jgi:hypothetical protein
MGLRALLVACLCTAWGCGLSDDADDGESAKDPCRADRELCADLNVAIFSVCGRTMDFVDPYVEDCREQFSCEMLEPLHACRIQGQALVDCICDTAGANGECLDAGAVYSECLGFVGWSCNSGTADCTCMRFADAPGGTCDPVFPCCRVDVSGTQCSCVPSDLCDSFTPRLIPVASCPPS